MTNTSGITRKDARAYAAVAVDEASSTATAPLAVPLTQGTSVLASERTWIDTYFDDKVESSDLVAVFDVGYDSMKRNLNRIMAFFVVLFSCYMVFFSVAPLMDDDKSGVYVAPIFVVYFGAIIFFFVRVVNRQKKNVHGLHVAVTRKGIRKDSNHFPFASFFLNSTVVRVDDQTSMLQSFVPTLHLLSCLFSLFNFGICRCLFITTLS